MSSEGGCYRFWKNALILEGTTKGDDFTKGAIRFRADLKLDLQSGKSVAGDTLLSVTNANSATIYIAMATNFVNYKDISGNPSERNKISMKNAGKNYARALQAHINVYQKYYNRVSLNLGRTSQADKPTDVRVKEFATSNDPHLVALYFSLVVICLFPVLSREGNLLIYKVFGIRN